MSFKGRALAATFLIPELRQDLFYSLQQYMRLEYVPTGKHGGQEYLFQYIERTRRGMPLVDASHSAIVQSFKRAVRAAGIDSQTDGDGWTPHSLRHMYGVYMVNDLPVDPERGVFGLPLADVQMMMGHSNIRDTGHYARSKQRRLEAKLEASDQLLHGLTTAELQLLPSFRLKLQGSRDDQ